MDNATDATKNRVKLRKSTKEKRKENAEKTPAGDFIDPNNGKIVPQDGPYDIGHKSGESWKKRKKDHIDNGSTRKEVIEAENNPDLCQIEDPSSNRSRRYD
ncbi:HNH/ENDO VII family nuclease [Bacteroides sp. OttesenSCG-928-N06]|nr:HNH/ENDO VII family nuclease [Bacteroides sp. OttesenSCG-928-N06]